MTNVIQQEKKNIRYSWFTANTKGNWLTTCFHVTLWETRMGSTCSFGSFNGLDVLKEVQEVLQEVSHWRGSMSSLGIFSSNLEGYSGQWGGSRSHPGFSSPLRSPQKTLRRFLIQQKKNNIRNTWKINVGLRLTTCFHVTLSTWNMNGTCGIVVSYCFHQLGLDFKNHTTDKVDKTTHTKPLQNKGISVVVWHWLLPPLITSLLFISCCSKAEIFMATSV